MSLLVTKEGMLTTVQDLGRMGYRTFGVNPGGVMDRTATRLLNQILENDPNAPVLELHFPAGEYLFEAETTFAVGGADFSPALSAVTIDSWTVYSASPGDVLKFPTKRSGSRSYLAVSGGFCVESWLRSCSTSLLTGKGGFHGRKLRTGDRISIAPFTDSDDSACKTIGRSLIPPYSQSPALRVVAGPEYDLLTGISQHALFTKEFVVSRQSDRMGFRLQGPTLFRLNDSEILSSGTTFGTIQLLPDGQMIVLMADHQTTGGYPRIATIVSVDLPLIAQLGPGDEVLFELIDLEQAECLALNFERDLLFLKAGVRARNGRL